MNQELEDESSGGWCPATHRECDRPCMGCECLRLKHGARVPTKRELLTFRTIMIIWLLVVIVIFVALIASHSDHNRHGG